MTERQLARQIKAGKARYLQYVLSVIALYPDDPDMAARHLSGARRAWGFRGRRGVTRAYIEHFVAQYPTAGRLMQQG